MTSGVERKKGTSTEGEQTGNNDTYWVAYSYEAVAAAVEAWPEESALVGPAFPPTFVARPAADSGLQGRRWRPEALATEQFHREESQQPEGAAQLRAGGYECKKKQNGGIKQLRSSMQDAEGNTFLYMRLGSQ